MSSRIRVLTIGHSYVVSLNRSIVRQVACDPDFEVTVAAPRFFHGDLRSLSMEPEPEDSPVHLVGLDVRWSKLIHVFRYDQRQLSRLIQEGEYDVVYAWEEPYICAGYQIARTLGGSKSRFCFRTFQNISKNHLPPFRYFERTVLARAQAWIAGGSLVFDTMRARGYRADCGRTLNLAVDTNAFKTLDESRRVSVRQQLQLETPIIGFVGRFTEAKGLRVLMRSMEQVGGDRPWSLLLLGSGPMEEEIREWARAQGWENRIRLVLASHDEVPAYLGAMDLLVAPSQTMPNWKEQFGRMLVEAFACGVPVIGSDSGEIPFVIGDAGRVVPEGDVEGWASAIVEFLDRPELRVELARKGLRRCKNYSVTAVAEDYRDFYRWISEKPAPPMSMLLAVLGDYPEEAWLFAPRCSLDTSARRKGSIMSRSARHSTAGCCNRQSASDAASCSTPTGWPFGSGMIRGQSAGSGRISRLPHR